MTTLEARVARALAERRRGLQRRFGWAGPPLACTVEPRARALVIRGEALSRRALAATLAELDALLPAGWTLEARVSQVEPWAWFAPGPGITRLWRTPLAARRAGLGGDGRGCASGHVPRDRSRAIWAEICPEGHVLVDMAGESFLPCLLGHDFENMPEHARRTRVDPGPAQGELCTELVPGDGPVGVLAAVGGAALVRARDGTLGWTSARLGAVTPAPTAVMASARPREATVALARALRRFRGAPYLLGGTTTRGVDCSGLVQRAVRGAFGVVLPRHSRDQLALAATPARALGEPGDLLFLGDAGESSCHVGVVLQGPRPGSRTLLHASSRRGRVIEEPLEQALARVATVRHMELEQLLALRL